MHKFIILVYFVIMVTSVLLSSCGNQAGNNNAAQKIQDSLANLSGSKGVTVREREVFHVHTQRSLDSMQHLIDKTDRMMRKQDEASRKTWDATRDSLRRILDHANRSLNNQTYKSDDEWNNFKNSINGALDSVESVWKRRSDISKSNS
jgi:ElaB/YqjD/DUF883 family membrane-anchored ribosome-binding protein